MGAMVSPLTGADGNVEFLVVGHAPGAADAARAGRPRGRRLAAHLDAVVAEVAPPAADPEGDA